MKSGLRARSLPWRMPEASCFLGRAWPSLGGPIRPEAGLFTPSRAYPSRGGPVCPEAGLSVPRRALCPEAGLSTPRRAYPMFFLGAASHLAGARYWGTSLMRRRTPLGPYSTPISRANGGLKPRWGRLRRFLSACTPCPCRVRKTSLSRSCSDIAFLRVHTWRPCSC
jgi:hypothetical protein